MTPNRVFSALFCLALMTLHGSARISHADTPPILSMNFEKGLDGWSALGQSASVTRTQDLAYVKEGKYALEFDYDVKKGDVNLLICPTIDTSLAGAKSIQFWIYSDYTTPMGFVLQKSNGARYATFFMTERKRWQRVSLSVNDFVLTNNPGDPPDPDGKLEMNQVSAMGIMDLGVFFSQMDSPEVRKFFQVSPGRHTLYLDDVTISANSLPLAFGPGDKGYLVDNFARPQAMWLPLGGVQLTPTDGDKPNTRYMRMTYQQTPGIPAGMMRNLPVGSLTGMTSLDFDAASQAPITLLLQMEQTDGSKFYASADIPGDGKFHHISISAEDFHVSNDSANANAKFDPDKVKSLYFIDPSGLINNANQGNILMLANIVALKSK
jgi:hypothetical protein